MFEYKNSKINNEIFDRYDGFCCQQSIFNSLFISTCHANFFNGIYSHFLSKNLSQQHNHFQTQSIIFHLNEMNVNVYNSTILTQVTKQIEKKSFEKLLKILFCFRLKHHNWTLYIIQYFFMPRD